MLSAESGSSGLRELEGPQALFLNRDRVPRGKNSIALLHRRPASRIGRAIPPGTALRQKAAIKGREFVLVPVNYPPRFKVDVDKPEMPFVHSWLMLENRRSACLIHREAFAVAEQIPSVEEIFVIRVRRRPDRRSAAEPLAGHCIDAVGKGHS